MSEGSRVKTKTTTPGVYKVVRTSSRGMTTRYEVAHRMNGILRSEGTYGTYDEACRVLRRVRASVDDDVYIPRRNGEVTFGEVSEQWLAKKVGRRPSTYAGYAALLKGPHLAQFADVPVKQMTYDRVGTFIASLEGSDLAASTVRHCFGVIKGVLDEAVKLRFIRTNPCHDVTKPPVTVPETYELQTEEVERLISVIGQVEDRWGLLVATAAYSGLRAGELAALRVRRVNCTLGTIDVREAVSVKGDGTLVVVAPKTRAGRRVVRELPPSLTTALARYIVAARLAPGDYLFGWKDAAGVSHPYWHSNFYRRVFKPAAQRAGLPVDKRPGEVTVRFHDLRHYCAAMLLQDVGTSAKDAQAQMGHASLAMTTDRYAYLMKASGKGRAGRMDAARAAASDDLAVLWLDEPQNADAPVTPVTPVQAATVTPLRQRASG